MSMGILVLALVVHARPLLLTNGSVRWMILMTRRERLRLRGTAWNIVVVRCAVDEDVRKAKAV
jgi:hypothetical protein